MAKTGLIVGAIIIGLIEVVIGVNFLPVVVDAWTAVDLAGNFTNGEAYDLTWMAQVGIILFGVTIMVLPFGILYAVLNRS